MSHDRYSSMSPPSSRPSLRASTEPPSTLQFGLLFGLSAPVAALTRRLETLFSLALFDVPDLGTHPLTTRFGLRLQYLLEGLPCQKLLLSNVSLLRYASHNLSLALSQSHSRTTLELTLDCRPAARLVLPYRIDPVSRLNTRLSLGMGATHLDHNYIIDRFEGVITNPRFAFGHLSKYVIYCSSAYHQLMRLVGSAELTEGSVEDNRILDEILEYEVKYPVVEEAVCADGRDYHEGQVWINHNAERCRCSHAKVLCSFSSSVASAAAPVRELC